MADRSLLSWLEEPRAERGIHFGRLGEEWDFWPYDRLASAAHRAAWKLAEAGVQRNDVVGIVARTGPGFVAAFFGALLAGATPSPIAPPLAFQNPEVYRRHVRALLSSSRPSVVVADPDLLESLEELAASTTIRAISIGEDLARDAGGARELFTPGTARAALLLFTSGSTGQARGVRVPFSAIETNVAAIRRWLRWTERDPFASWLPLHHDMGLIGGLISSMVGGCDLWLMQPEEFIRRPLRFLRCFGASGARLTTMPNFGLDYIVRRISSEALAGLDFSHWRAVIVGAERIDPRSLDRFRELLAPFGFSRRALLPAYGLAEATLAVTGVPLEEEWTGVSVRPSSLAFGRRVDDCDSEEGAQVVVGCGRPLPDVSVAVVDSDGELLPDGRVGEVVVRGPSVAAGYVAQQDAPSLTRFSSDGLHTGDAGFLSDGQLFVLGRLGDSMKVRGRVLFAEDLEVALDEVGAPRHKVAALLGDYRGAPSAVVVFEHGSAEEKRIPFAAVATALRRWIEDVELFLVDAPKGTIQRTSSGKTRRRELWRKFLDGELSGELHTMASGTTTKVEGASDS